MKISQLFAKWFSRKTTAQEALFEPETNGSVGIADECMFTPQAFLTFIGCYQAANTGKPFIGNISDIKVMNIFNNDDEYKCPAFTIKSKNGYFWAQLGNNNEVFYSKFSSLKFDKPTKRFLVEIKRLSVHTNYSAICEQKNGNLYYFAIIWQNSSTDEFELITDLLNLPRPIAKAIEIVETF